MGTAGHVDPPVCRSYQRTSPPQEVHSSCTIYNEYTFWSIICCIREAKNVLNKGEDFLKIASCLKVKGDRADMGWRGQQLINLTQSE